MIHSIQPGDIYLDERYRTTFSVGVVHEVSEDGKSFVAHETQYDRDTNAYEGTTAGRFIPIDSVVWLKVGGRVLLAA